MMLIDKIIDFFQIRWQASNLVVVNRIRIIIGLFVILFIILDIKLLLVSSSKKFTNKYNIAVKSYRRDIVDRNNKIVATSLPIYSLYANPNKMVDKKQALDKIAKIIKLDNKAKILTELNSDKNFVWIKHDITPNEEKLINQSGIVGFSTEKSFKRMYTYGNLTSHAIGYVDRDNQGLSGIEKFLNDELLIDKYKALSLNSKTAKSLELTLDVNIQYIVYDELNSAINEFNALGGVGVVVKPGTGEIISLVSKPDYNPHQPGSASSQELFNKATLGTYEFGSIFKILTLAIGLDTKKTNINRNYDITHLKIGGWNFQDVVKTQGIYSVSEIFAKSSNKGTGMIALDIGSQVFQKYLRLLGIADQVITEIPEKATPYLPRNKYWNDVSMVTISYGYGIATSVLNLIQAIVPTINGGIMYPLTLLKSDVEPEGKRVFSEQTSMDIRKLLRFAVTQGYGKRAEVRGYLVGGKSGTANKIKGKGYARNSRRSSFIAAFPMHDPQYLIYVMLDDPQPTKNTNGLTTAGVNAAPTVAKIISRIASVKGMLRYDENDPVIKKQLTISKEKSI